MSSAKWKLSLITRQQPSTFLRPSLAAIMALGMEPSVCWSNQNILTTTEWIALKSGTVMVHGDGEAHWLWWSPDLSSSTTTGPQFFIILWNMSTATTLIDVDKILYRLSRFLISQQLLNGLPWNLLSDIHVPFRMSFNNFGDPLSFHLVPWSILHFMTKYLYQCFITWLDHLSTPSPKMCHHRTASSQQTQKLFYKKTKISHYNYSVY